MTRPKTPPKTPEAEAELSRKLILGLLGTLEQKGILTTTEVNHIIIAARQAAYPPPPPPPTQVAPGRRVNTQWPTEGKVNSLNPATITGIGTKEEENVPVIDMEME